MTSLNLGGHILERVGPLVENAAHVRAEGTYVNAAGCLNKVGREPDGRLRVGTDFVPAPSGSIGAEFVDERRGDGVIPDRR